MNPALTTAQANAILDVVIDAGNFQLPRPTEAPAILQAAVDVLRQAENASRAGVSTTAVRKVMEIGANSNYDAEIDKLIFIGNNEDVATTAIPNGDIARFDNESPATGNDNNSSEDTAAVSTDARLMQSDQEKESSQIELPTLPRDFSKVGDLELRSLHAERHGILSKVIHELGLEESDYQSSQVAYEQAYKEAMAVATSGKVTDKRDEAFIDPDVTTWRQTVDNHHKNVIVLRSYKEILESEIRGLSREFTMRTGERTATP